MGEHPGRRALSPSSTLTEILILLTMAFKTQMFSFSPNPHTSLRGWLNFPAPISPYFPLLPSHKESDTPCFQLSQTPRKTASHVWSQDFLPLPLITWATECHPNILVFKTHPALPWNHSSNSDLHGFLRGLSKSLPDPSSWVSLLLSCFFSHLLQISHMKIWWFPSRSLSGVPQK